MHAVFVEHSIGSIKRIRSIQPNPQEKHQVILTCQRNKRRVASVLKILIKEFIKEGSILASD
jgi:hypothetical protein